MKRLIGGLVCVLIGVAGLVWLSGMPRGPWRTGAWGPGPFLGGPRWMPGRGPGMMGGYGGPGGMPGPGAGLTWGTRRFASSGEQIYYTGVSRTAGPIPRAGGPPWVQHPGVGCVACHGVQGRGGVPVMMGTAIPEDIRYSTLTAGKGEMDHPPYTDPTIERAITRGVDPANKPLDWTMPRWEMTAGDLDDLLAYLKTLR